MNEIMKETLKGTIEGSKVKEIIKELKEGRFVIVLDDKNREDEADLLAAAEFITQEKIAFMLKHTSGIICVPMTSERRRRIGIPAIKPVNKNRMTAPFTVAIDSKECKTGVSTADRCLTIKKIVDDNATIKDFIVPGHVFPLVAHDKGLKKRKGHTEAAVELTKMAGLKEVAVVAELMNEDGTMMRDESLKKFSDENNIKVVKIKELM